jgi:hypothetical protein
MLFFFYGIDTSQPCGSSSSVDFVHFFWQNGGRISLHKYALTVFRPTNNSEPTMLCLKYYRANADGWKDTSDCGECVLETRRLVRPFSDCRLPDECSCSICNQQPPYLHDIISHTLFGRHLKYFKLTVHTTFQEYVYAALPGCVETGNLLPPEYPIVRVWCRFYMFENKFHRDCPGQGT